MSDVGGGGDVPVRVRRVEHVGVGAVLVHGDRVRRGGRVRRVRGVRGVRARGLAVREGRPHVVHGYVGWLIHICRLGHYFAFMFYGRVLAHVRSGRR